MIYLSHPELLLLGGLLVIPHLLRPRRAWQYSSLQLLPSPARVGWTTLLTTGLLGTGLLLLLIALANPQRHTVHTTEAVQARDIVLTLDLSLSMEGFLLSETQSSEARPAPLTKLDLIQRAALTFVEKCDHDRLGLLVFGDEAFGAWPLSTAHTTLRTRLQHLDELMPTSLRGTNLAQALVTSLDHMQDRGQATTKMLILLTDGQDTIGPEVAKDILRRLRHQNVNLYVLGVGLSETASIAGLARQEPGRYFDIGKAGDLDLAFQEIDQLDPSRMLVTRKPEPELLYRFFAIPGVLLLLTSMVCKIFWVLEI